MAYELIDNKLNLWSCSISDLTSEQVSEFLDQWDDGAGIETLTVFYNQDKGRIVLNQDNADYDIYLDLCTTYLLLDSEHREKFFSELKNKNARDAMEILNMALKRKVENPEFEPSNIMKIIGHQKISVLFRITDAPDYGTVLRKYPGCMTTEAAVAMYFAGYINGIRAERLKRYKGGNE